MRDSLQAGLRYDGSGRCFSATVDLAQLYLIGLLLEKFYQLGEVLSFLLDDSAVLALNPSLDADWLSRFSW